MHCVAVVCTSTNWLSGCGCKWMSFWSFLCFGLVPSKYPRVPAGCSCEHILYWVTGEKCQYTHRVPGIVVGNDGRIFERRLFSFREWLKQFMVTCQWHLFYLNLIFVFWSTCPDSVYRAITVHADFPARIILYCYSVELSSCPYKNFPQALENMICTSNWAWDDVDMVVLRELYNW